MQTRKATNKSNLAPAAQSSNSALAHQWTKGPVSDKDLNAHARNIICMAIRENEIVTGSEDHGIKCTDLNSMRVTRELYTKRYGHTEFVTSLAHVPNDGRILSGGMDSKLCLWTSKGVKCDDLVGHSGSISQVACDENNIGVSSSYDSQIKVWDLDKKTCVHTLPSSKSAHTQAVTHFFWKNSLIVSGSRDASLCLWDVNSGQLVSCLKRHKLPIMCIDAIDNDSAPQVFLSASQDGTVKCWDLRSMECVADIQAHNGSVNEMKISSSKIVTGGSDKAIRVLDPKFGFKVCTEMKHHKDVVTCLRLMDDLCVSGSGNGNVLVHSIETGKCFYGMKVSEEGAVSCIEIVSPDKLVCAGGDGKLVVFDYSQED